MAGRYTDAIPHYERAIQLDATFAQGHAGIAESNMFMKKYGEAITHMERAVRVDPTYVPGYALIAEAHLRMNRPDEARTALVASAEQVLTPVGKFGQLTAAALMYVPAGKPREALAEMTSLAAGAEEQDLRAQAATAYRNAALLEGAFGNRRAVAGHLAKADAVAPRPGPNATAASGAAQYRMAALAYALSGQWDRAKASAAQFATAVTAGTPVQQNNNHELMAIIAVGDKNLVLAKEELARAGPGAALGKTLFANALRNSRRKAEATALKAEILDGTMTLTVFDVIARAKAQQL
jgi:tetratricopeptide (TPR) repeat protein